MKISIFASLITVAANTQSSHAFQMMHNMRSRSSSVTKLHMSSENLDRREALFRTAGSIFGAVAVVETLSPQSAFAGSRPEYLTEPTEEFKESERQRAEFRTQQLQIKKKFVTVLERFTGVSKTEKELIADLQELKLLLATYNGLPLGIKKDDVVKQVRSVKAKGFWPTDVEYAYQAVIREIAYQQSPNKDKDMANPL